MHLKIIDAQKLSRPKIQLFSHAISRKFTTQNIYNTKFIKTATMNTHTYVMAVMYDK